MGGNNHTDPYEEPSIEVVSYATKIYYLRCKLNRVYKVTHTEQMPDRVIVQQTSPTHGEQTFVIDVDVLGELLSILQGYVPQ